MKSLTRLGIWMDHSTAHIMELSNNEVKTVTLESTPSFLERIKDLRMDEKLMHNKEQNEDSDFFEKLSNIIRNYNEVLLFGPTEAKNELYNRFKNDRRFENLKFFIEPTDKITDNQQKAFLKSFFNKK